MPYPTELDCPHWAREVVNKTRERLNLPDAITDRMIYARLYQSYRQKLDEAKTDESMLKLIEEVREHDGPVSAGAT